MNHAAPPLVSVCIPLYNGVLYIRQAVESVLVQTLTDWELIITDDCSTDGSSEIAASFSDTRIRYMPNPERLGAEANWNRCVNAGIGKYRKLLCHDDRLHPECLARQVEVLENSANQGIALVAAARHIITPEGRELLTRRWKWQSQRIAGGDAIRQIVRSGTNLIGEPGAVLFRAVDWGVIKGFNASLPYVIDLEFWLGLLQRGDCYYISEPLFDFRISAQSWSYRLCKQQSSQFQQLIRQFSRKSKLPICGLFILQGTIRSKVSAFLRQMIYRWWCHDHK